MTYSCQMITRDLLAKKLKSVNVEAVALLAGVSTKTVYRLRHKATSPSLETVERLLAAVAKLSTPSKGR